MPQKEGEKRATKKGRDLYLALGIILGGAIGQSFNNIVLGICVGVALAITLSALKK